MKEANFRKTGITVVGNLPWRTHFCQFYQTKKDLLDVLVPFFKTGLANNEFCVWVTSEFLNTKEAIKAMAKAVPSFDKYLKKGQMEIFPHTEWYLKGGSFEMKRVLKDWVGKHDKAIAAGYDGTRVSGNPFWIDSKKDWEDFSEYEAEINKVINRYKLLVLCTYSLEKCTSAEILDVVSNHEFVLVKRRGKWENIEDVGHKKVEMSLQQSKERFNQYIRLSEHLGWTTNARGEVEEDIPFWRKYTGQSYREVRGTGWAKALHPHDIEHSIKVWKKAVEAKIPYETEYRVRRYDGVYGYFFVHGTPVLDENGNVQEWVGSCINITERKKVEEESSRKTAQLEELNRSLQKELIKEEALIENIGEGILAVDKNEKIIALNKKTEAFFGWKENKMIGKKLLDNFNLADEEGRLIPTELRPIKLALTTGKLIQGTYFFHMDKDKSMPLFITSSPIILDKAIIGAVSVYRDISQQVAIDKARDEFISIASHELRTPLSAISWSMERLYEDKKHFSAIQKKSLDQIYRQTQNMIQLTNNLLAITKMELEDFPRRYEEAKPLEIAARVVRDLKNQMKEKQIKFRTVLDRGIDTYRTYSNAIYIILHNLLSNAVKFTPNNGKITLKIYRTDNPLENSLILQVSDTGYGIPQAALNKIFQKAYRAKNTRDRVEGIGLGLYITKAMVDHLKGNISVKSKQNEGTIFTVTLPFIDEENKDSKKGYYNNTGGQISLSL